MSIADLFDLFYSAVVCSLPSPTSSPPVDKVELRTAWFLTTAEVFSLGHGLWMAIAEDFCSVHPTSDHQAAQCLPLS